MKKFATFLLISAIGLGFAAGQAAMADDTTVGEMDWSLADNILAWEKPIPLTAVPALHDMRSQTVDGTLKQLTGRDRLPPATEIVPLPGAPVAASWASDVQAITQSLR